MTSTSIYTPITPTYLYIKQHSVTKKKYFGKTTKDPYEYNGSGKHWSRHIKKHGKEHIVTLWVSDLYYDTSIIDVALKFSADNDIVNSKEWANMEPENGLNGWVPGRKRGQYKKSGKPRKPHKPHKPRSDKGKPKSEKHKANMKGRVAPNKGKSTSQETKDKISANMTGKKRGPYKKHKNKGESQPQITCPHCGKTGGNSNMKRWHFDKCKKADN
jgi:hypothetical protein